MVVILDRFQYLWEGNKQLADEKYDKELDRPIFPETIPMVKRIKNQLWEQKYITKKQKEYLMGPANPQPRQLYMLPKIHKNRKGWSKPFKILQGRQIVIVRHNSEMQSTLNPFLLSIQVIQRTRDFIDIVQKSTWRSPVCDVTQLSESDCTLFLYC